MLGHQEKDFQVLVAMLGEPEKRELLHGALFTYAVRIEGPRHEVATSINPR